MESEYAVAFDAAADVTAGEVRKPEQNRRWGMVAIEWLGRSLLGGLMNKRWIQNARPWRLLMSAEALKGGKGDALLLPGVAFLDGTTCQ